MFSPKCNILIKVPPKGSGTFSEDGKEYKCQRWWITIRTWHFMNRVEKLHICAQSGCDSVHKTSATQARLNSNMEMNFHVSPRSYW